MKMKPQHKRLGAQLWVERDDSPERVDALLAAMKQDGLELARIFLLWVWIEEKPGEWDWRLYDAIFEAAARHGIGIKATLCANSGPAHAGFPLQLHTHTGFLEERDRTAAAGYIQQCVSRYRNHPALDQWILWNEPFANLPGPRSGLFNAFFREFCRSRFDGDIDALNRDFLTSFSSFDAIPDFRDIPHPAHSWQSGWVAYPFATTLRYAVADWLTTQVQWVADQVRLLDDVTPRCVNPVTIHSNHACGGTQLGDLARAVDVLGASFHAPWHWAEYDPTTYSGLVSQGIKRLASTGVGGVETTEMPFGGQGYCTSRPAALSPANLAQTILASLASGAENATGWLYNCRRQNFEAGDWALCNQDDSPSERNTMVRTVRRVLDDLDREIGAWNPLPPTVLALNSFQASVVEDIEGAAVDMSKGKIDPDAGLTPNDAYPGATFLALEAQKRGLAASVAELRDFLDRPADFTEVDTVFACQMTAMAAADMQRLLAWTLEGGTLVLDALTGRKNPAAELHVPWPAGLDALGLQVKGIETDVSGWPVTASGLDAGAWTALRSIVACDPEAWSPLGALRFAADGTPVVLARDWGKGRVVFVRGQLASTVKKLACAEEGAPGITQGIDAILSQTPAPALSLRHGHRNAFSIPVRGDTSKAWFVFAPTLRERGGTPLHLGCRGAWKDLWSGWSGRARLGEISLTAEDGIAILIPDSPAP